MNEREEERSCSGFNRNYSARGDFSFNFNFTHPSASKEDDRYNVNNRQLLQILQTS